MLVATVLASIFTPGLATQPESAGAKAEAALTNILTLDRPGKTALATIWDGNKYVQCRRLRDHALRCEAAGARMQPSLSHIITPDRVGRLAAMGWTLDSSFGNYAQTFPRTIPAGRIADKIVRTLGVGYDADLAHLEVRTDWITAQPCPPRNGPRQNLAGMINDAASMASTAIHTCTYAAPGPEPRRAHSAAEVIAIDGPRITGEIQRLFVNRDRPVHVVLSAAAGYVQCEPTSSPPELYCEAASADSVPALSAVLTPERVALLHAAGYADPGRSPNYAKSTPLDRTDPTTVADDLLKILYDVYGYDGVPTLAVATE